MNNIQDKLKTFLVTVFLLSVAASALLAVLRKPQGADYVLWVGFVFLLLAVLIIPLKEAMLAFLFLLSKMINNLGRFVKNIPQLY